MGRKSLAEQLAEFADPTPRGELDPEEDLWGGAARLAEEDADDAAEADDSRQPSRKAREGLRLRGDIALAGGEYVGRKTTRAQWEAEAGVEGQPNRRLAGDDDDDEEEESEGDDGEDDEDDDEAGPSDDDGGERDDDEEMEDVEREYAELRAEEGELLSQLKEKSKSDAAKGAAVAAQQQLWEQALETRIMLQKAFGDANRLPLRRARAACSRARPDVAAALSEAALAARRALRSLLSLREELVSRTPASAAAAPLAKNRKRRGAGEAEEEAESIETLWERCEQGYVAMAPYRDEALDRWHRKATLATGGAARASGLVALNQALSQQVRHALSDPARLVARSQLPAAAASAARILDARDGKDAAEEAEEEGAKTTSSRDPETFDDADFYQQLLKEFMESAGNADDDAALKRAPKRRKTVDRRASKGRRIRYDVQDKLVNFVSPVDKPVPPMLQSILSNLFGAKREL